jgi:hypothetical protein
MFAALLLAFAAVTQTDQTVQVQKGTRLDVNNFAGDVAIKTWDKDAVRVQVTHSDREVIDITPGDQTLRVRSHNKMGPPRSLDYAITVPAWMATTVNGVYTDVTLEGVNGDVSVESAHGDVKLIGGSGVVTIKALQGDVTVEKARGKIDIHVLNQDIHLTDVSGDVSAETTNGDIVIDRMDSSNVDLYTVNGDILYDGALKDKGVYRLTTHNGVIAMPVSDKANATLMVRTYTGNFKATFPLKLEDSNTKKRVTLTYGNGSAHVELESFGGTISLRRPEEPAKERDMKKRRDERRGRGSDRTHDFDRMDETLDQIIASAVDVNIDTVVDAAMDEAMASIGRIQVHVPRVVPKIRDKR